MKIRTFQAQDMREALKIVKEEMGVDAVILSTRSVREKGANGAPTGRHIIEVKACPPAMAQAIEEANPATDAPIAVTPRSEARETPAPRRGGFSAVVSDDPTPPTRNRPSDRAAAREAQAAPPERELAPRSRVAAPEPAHSEPVEAPVGRAGSRASMRAAGGAKNLASDLSTIRSSLATLEARVAGLPGPMDGEIQQLDGEGRKLYSWLIMHGTEEPIARKLAVSSRNERGGFEGSLKKYLKFRDPLEGTARVIVLVGPTGVGKTTTLAKIAADLLLNRRRSVGMITLDTFRVGAVAQLETYAKLLQVRLVVARSLSEVKAGMHALNRCDYILVDTVGSSPYNRRQVNSTGSLLPVMGEDRETLLCMAANVRETEQQAVFRRFSTLNPTGLIFTKLDETVTFGNLLNVGLRARLPLTMYADGQRVPENLGWFSAEVLAKWFEQRDGEPGDEMV
ncbi:GTP-binding signal recognition particle SRP54, G- domain [Magnetococcus marinus MC-1]|uniref:Flagellar biosynthesis protein FlhF n=1 Tax=Magnetococcus marinus (strain ATCC BAA-1437 / JCM 17883 / MC-1) TaxID=156889 RepID=A0LC37_MAGMM|nr:flagellar biosynthesis protein FlhF [Magnetococcus marinus]ABK45530.1 GTP-binding signal recognition particle SRP54, G- domain [Magnetococcus marinus MC-1]